VGLVWGKVHEIGGALLLGVELEIPMAWVTGRITKGKLTLIETLGFVSVCGDLAAALDFSYILACMAMGCVVSNFACHDERPLHAIKGVQQPFLIVFFLLAGFQAGLASSFSLGVVSVAYILGRVIGEIFAGYVGASLVGFSKVVRYRRDRCREDLPFPTFLTA
jgi:Kef-type K+ transport system membrane component KefB